MEEPISPKPTFQYPPLSNSRSDFRLLRVLPAPSKSDPICCELFTAAISASESMYIAGSYTWGPPEPTHPISLNGSTYPVRENLAQLLRVVRTPDEGVIIWIDAICINQADLREREYQVSLMGPIYGLADYVAVWLGASNALIENSMDSIVRLGSDFTWHIPPKYDKAVLSVVGPVHEQTCTVAAFFNLPWWFRVWTVQEYALARRRVFYCEERVIEGEVLEGYRVGDLKVSMLDSITHLEVLQGYGYKESVDRNGRRKRNISFLETLSQFEMREATDPRDRIYGMLGIAGNGTNGDASTGQILSAVKRWSGTRPTPTVEPSSTPHHRPTSISRAQATAYTIWKPRELLTARYDRTPQETCAALVRRWVSTQRNLDFLEQLGDYGGWSTQTYVPQWTSHNIPNSNIWDCNFRIANVGAYNACANHTLDFFIEESDAAACTGALVDTIAATTTAPWTRYHDVVEEAQKLVGFTKTPRIAEERAVHEAFLLTMSAGLEHVTFPNSGPVITRKTVNSYLTFWLGEIMKDAWEDTWVHVGAAEYTDSFHSVHQFFRSVIYGRRFAVMEKRRFGWVPWASRVGNVVGVLYGGRTPCVLRPKGEVGKEVYEMLGTAYVHSIMDGECFRDSQEGEKRAMRTFSIL